MKKNAPYRYIFILLTLVVCYSCSVAKFIPEDEILYAGSKIIVETEEDTIATKIVKEELNTLIPLQPNSKFLGSNLGYIITTKHKKKNPDLLING